MPKRPCPCPSAASLGPNTGERTNTTKAPLGAGKVKPRTPKGRVKSIGRDTPEVLRRLRGFIAQRDTRPALLAKRHANRAELFVVGFVVAIQGVASENGK